MLDVACGAGQIAIPAARAGARVTGIDIASNWIEQARSRAKAEGVDVRFEEGDAELLSFEDAAFDLVLSLIGAMFAPRPERVAAELVRVCRPGGRIAMANWTPEGHVGQMFKIIGKHVPPPLMASPLSRNPRPFLGILRNHPVFETAVAHWELKRLMRPAAQSDEAAMSIWPLASRIQRFSKRSSTGTAQLEWHATILRHAASGIAAPLAITRCGGR
jgi:ubiquinone/menaquinone biosynthesis C-methylase UbiE